MEQLIKSDKRSLVRSMPMKEEQLGGSGKPQTDIMKLSHAGNRWLSQIEAITVQLQYLKSKIDTAVVADKPKDIVWVQSLQERLSGLEMAENKLSGRIRKHLKYLQVLLKRSKIKNGIIFSALHMQIEDEISSFIQTFTNLRGDFIVIKYLEKQEIEK